VVVVLQFHSEVVGNLEHGDLQAEGVAGVACMEVMVRTSFSEVSKHLFSTILRPTVYFYQFHHPRLCDLLHRFPREYLLVQEIRINTKTEMGMLLLWMVWTMVAGKKVWDAGHLAENPRKECPGKQIFDC
jgi:hypothetical protein